ncbi:superoxide dismutase [candidate division KSB1 bacterium]|nr:superoxide dismutase [candidate division KSB1 bacterium]
MKAIQHTLTAIFLLALVAMSPVAFSHCEVPCGIYNDPLRCDLIAEHITTIEKAMMQIKDLSTQKTINYNQLVRWITTKDEHADKIQEIVSQYFLTQRIKSVDEQNKAEYASYISKLRLLHEMLILAMKTKQTTDLANIDQLRLALTRFKEAYFGSIEIKHEH